MQSYVPDLELLAKHTDTRIARIAGQLLNLVRAQGSILTETANLRKQTQRIEEETTKMKQKAEELRQLKRDNENQVLDEKMAAIKAKAEDLKKAKDRRKKGLKEEQPELKIVEDKTGMSAYEAALYDIRGPEKGQGPTEKRPEGG